jgi:putative membrane protein
MSLLIQILRQSRSIARIETGFFVRRAKLLWSIAVVALIPCLYSLIYLSSIWDPAAHSNELKVGLVNLDQGLVYRDQQVNVGQELSDMLKAQARFDYQLMGDEAAARTKVKQGQLAFALIIPKNFSANAVPGEQVGAGQLVVFASQGNHLESARMAQQFATELGHKINESLNTKRWSLVLVNAAGSKQSVTRLRQGLQELHHGAEELNQGASQASVAAKAVHQGAQHLSDNLAQLTDQSKKMGGDLRQLESTRPRNSDLRKLDEGADSLASGMTELGQGLHKIKTGNEQLLSAVSAFKEEANNQLLVSSAMADKVSQVYAGLQKIDHGLQASLDNGKKLEDGARQMKTGVTGLTQGVRQINAASRTMSTQFPDDAQLESLDKGATELASGSLKLSQGNESISQASRRLEAGLALVGQAIPATDNVLEGSAEGLADSVRPRMEIDLSLIHI